MRHYQGLGKSHPHTPPWTSLRTEYVCNPLLGGQFETIESGVAYLKAVCAGFHICINGIFMCEQEETGPDWKGICSEAVLLSL